MGWLTSLLNSVGSAEFLLVVFAAAVAVVVSVCTRAFWILGFGACFVAAALFTPPDPLSMLLVAVPLCGVFAVVCRRRRKAGTY